MATGSLWLGQAIEDVVLPYLNFWKATLLLYSICIQPKGCSTSPPTWRKTKYSKNREVFGTSAYLPVTTGFLQWFARKNALENGTRDARLKKDQKAQAWKRIYNCIFNILYPLLRKWMLLVRHCKHYDWQVSTMLRGSVQNSAPESSM